MKIEKTQEAQITFIYKDIFYLIKKHSSVIPPLEMVAAFFNYAIKLIYDSAEVNEKTKEKCEIVLNTIFNDLMKFYKEKYQ